MGRNVLIMEFDINNMGISEETRYKMSQSHLGKTSPRKGKTKYNINYNNRKEYQKELLKVNPYKKKWYLQNRDDILLKAKIYRDEHKEEISKIKHMCYERRKHEISNSGKKYYNSIRKKLFKILGGEICNNCGFDVYEALQFDHINGGGTKERKKFGKNLYMYRFYLQNPKLAKKNLQILCANCNFIKHLYGERGGVN